MLKFNNKVLKILDKWLLPNTVVPPTPPPVGNWKLLVANPTNVYPSDSSITEVFNDTWVNTIPNTWLRGSTRTEFRGKSLQKSTKFSTAHATIQPIPAESEYNDYALYNVYMMYYAESKQPNQWSTYDCTILFDYNMVKFYITPYSQVISPGGYYQNNCVTVTVKDSNNNTLSTFEFGNNAASDKGYYIMNFKVLYDLNTKYSYVTCTPGSSYTPTDVNTYKWYLLSTNAWNKSKLNGQAYTYTQFGIPPFDNTLVDWKQSGITWSYMELYGCKGELDIVLDNVTHHDYRNGI